MKLSKEGPKTQESNISNDISDNKEKEEMEKNTTKRLHKLIRYCCHRYPPEPYNQHDVRNNLHKKKT